MYINNIAIIHLHIYVYILCRGADKSLVFLEMRTDNLQHKKIIFLGWVKEVRTTKS
jgi:hypothetical protein